MEIAELQLTVRSREAEAAADRTKRKLEQVGTTAEKTTTRMQAGWNSLRSSLSSVRGLLVAVGASMAFRAGIRTIGQFEQSMANARAVMRGITQEEFADLNAEARRLGESTVFSASQAADAVEALGRAGFTAKETINALGGTLNLAAAGSLDMGNAAAITGKVLRGFGMDARESSRIADVLAMAASLANQEVADLGDSMKYVAPISKNLGVSLEETTAAVSVLANAGIVGGEAGTTFRMVVRSLLRPTREAIKTLQEYGVTADEVNPEIVGLTQALQVLADANIEVTDAAKIFEARAFTGAQVLSDQVGQVKELYGWLKKANGEAERQAGIKIDTIQGQWKLLISAVEEFTLKIGDEGASGAVRGLLNVMTDVVTKANANWKAMKLGAQVFALETEALFWDLVSIGELAWGKLKNAFVDALKWMLENARGVLKDIGTLMGDNRFTQDMGGAFLNMAGAVQSGVRALEHNRAAAVGDMGKAAQESADSLREMAKTLTQDFFGEQIAEFAKQQERQREEIKKTADVDKMAMAERMSMAEELLRIQQELFDQQERVRLGAAIKQQKKTIGATTDVEMFKHEEDKLRMLQEERARRLEYNLTKPSQAFVDGWEIATERFGSITQRIAETGAGLADSLDANITDGLMSMIDGTKSVGEAFRDMANQIISDLIRIMIQQLIVRTALQAVGGLFGGGGSSPIGSFGAKDGGFVGATDTVRTGFAPHAWSGARRYSTGGLTGDEVPVVAHQGELILNKDQQASVASRMDGNSKSVQIVNVVDPRMVSEEINANPNAILNVMSRHPAQFRRVLGLR